MNALSIFFLIGSAACAPSEPETAVPAEPAIEQQPSPPAELSEEPPQLPILLQRIFEAKRLLATASIGTTRIGGENAVLALWKPGTDQIVLVSVRGGMSRTRGYSVELARRNGVNSEYRVTSPDGYVVLGIRTNVRSQRGRSRSQPVVYVPYSAPLRSPEVERNGLEYLTALVDDAASAIDDRDVRSLMEPDSLVSETVPERVVLALLIIEHMETSEFAADGIEPALGRVLATLGLNGDRAYDLAGSSAGALGLAQFIEPTYRITRRRYPAAKLDRSFRSGMADHRNAVVASYCLLDWALTRLPENVRKDLLSRPDEEDLGAYLAAAYNGGEERAAAAYLRGKDAGTWEKPDGGLMPETIMYVREFRATYRHLFAAPQTTEPVQDHPPLP